MCIDSYYNRGTISSGHSLLYDSMLYLISFFFEATDGQIDRRAIKAKIQLWTSELLRCQGRKQYVMTKNKGIKRYFNRAHLRASPI